MQEAKYYGCAGNVGFHTLFRVSSMRKITAMRDTRPKNSPQRLLLDRSTASFSGDLQAERKGEEITKGNTERAES